MRVHHLAAGVFHSSAALVPEAYALAQQSDSEGEEEAVHAWPHPPGHNPNPHLIPTPAGLGRRVPRGGE